MKSTLKKISIQDQVSEGEMIHVGEIVAIDRNGRPLVKCAGSEEVVEARILSHAVDSIEKLPTVFPISVLLALPRQSDNVPIILGRVIDRLGLGREELRGAKGQKVATKSEGLTERVILEADNELILRCGGSALILSGNGQVTLRGTEITSRASKTNKIKGASVRIN